MSTHDKDDNYKGTAIGGLTTGIIGTALGALNSGLFNGNGGGIFGGNGGGWGYGGRDNLAARAQVTYDFEIAKDVCALKSRLAALEVAQIKDEKIAKLEDELTKSQVLRYIDDKTCGMMKGMSYLSPAQLADPYMGNRQVISTHAPVVEIERKHRDHDYDRWY